MLSSPSPLNTSAEGHLLIAWFWKGQHTTCSERDLVQNIRFLEGWTFLPQWRDTKRTKYKPNNKNSIFIIC